MKEDLPMKGTLRIIMFGLLMAALCAGCSKQPTQEINTAKSAVDAAVSEGAEKYAPAESQKVNEELAIAMTEVRAQDGKFFKDYKKSREMLLKVKADADVLKAGLDAKKAEAGKNARAAFEAAKAAVDAARSGVTEMPERLSMETEAIRADIKGLDESLAEVHMLIKTEDYLTASDKAGVIKEKAAGISEEIRQATEKTAPKRVKKR
jgi:hypothetical protein